MRKLEPLERALNGADLWITDVRREQSGNRASVPLARWDPERGLLKANPLADWDIGTIRDFAAAHAVPINPLHARGYASIGCAPCTRAIKPGGDERGGRWWWENDEKRECGLHVPSTNGQPAFNPDGIRLATGSRNVPCPRVSGKPLTRPASRSFSRTRLKSRRVLKKAAGCYTGGSLGRGQG